MKAKGAAPYTRVSTDENRQDPETQLRELRDFAEHRLVAPDEERRPPGAPIARPRPIGNGGTEKPPNTKGSLG